MLVMLLGNPLVTVRRVLHGYTCWGLRSGGGPLCRPTRAAGGSRLGRRRRVKGAVGAPRATRSALDAVAADLASRLATAPAGPSLGAGFPAAATKGEAGLGPEPAPWPHWARPDDDPGPLDPPGGDDLGHPTRMKSGVQLLQATMCPLTLACRPVWSVIPPRSGRPTPQAVWLGRPSRSATLEQPQRSPSSQYRQGGGYERSCWLRSDPPEGPR